MNRSIFLACLATCLAFSAGCKKADPVAAVVNGETITLDQYHKYLELKPEVRIVVDPSKLQAGGNGQLPQQPLQGPVVGSLGLQALSDLIQQAVLRQLATDERVYPTSDEIKSEIEDRTKENPSFVRNLTSAGYSIEMIRGEIALQLAQFKLTTQGITVSDDEIHKYIQDNPKEFIVPESVDMVWMLVPDEKTKSAADADLKLGTQFPVVAQKYTVAPNARAQHYQFPEQFIPRLANYGPDLMPAVQKTPELQQTAWIKFTEGWAKFYINKKNPERKLPIDDAMLRKVRRALLTRKGTQARDLAARIQEKMKAAKVEIMIDNLKDPWKAQMDALTSGVPGGGAPAK